MAKNLRDKKLNEEHIEQVMSVYGEYLMRLIYLYVKDWSIAEDILQEVFFTYYQKANQFEHRSSLKTYLSKMAINRCHDYLQSWKNKRIIFTETVGNLLSNSKSIEESYELESDIFNLTRYVLDLPIKYREAILLYYYHEFTINEISKLLNCPESTVKTRLHRAKSLLRNTVDTSEWEGFQDEQI